MIANRVIFSAQRGPKIAVLSLLVHVLAVVIAWCVVQSIAAPVLFGQVFQLVPPVMLITMLPISIAGWGVREATMGLAFGYAGLMTNEGVNVSLLFGAVIVHRRRVRRAGLDFQRREGGAGRGADRGSGITAALHRMTISELLPLAFRRARRSRAFGRHHLGDPAAAAAARAGAAERAVLASRSDAAGRGHRGDRGDAAGRRRYRRVRRCRRHLKIPLAVFAATLFIAVVGFADDIKSIPVLPRLVLQAAAVGVDHLHRVRRSSDRRRPARSGSNAACCCSRASGSSISSTSWTGSTG